MLNVVNSLCEVLISFALRSQSQIHASPTFMILTQQIYWTINFVTAMGLLYLFKYQGERRRQEVRIEGSNLMQFIESTVKRRDSLVA